MLHLFGKAAYRIPDIVVRASFLYYSLLTFIAATVAYFNAEWGRWLVSTWEGISAWWALAPIALLAAGILAKAISEEYLELERERDKLRAERTTHERRRAFKDALAVADKKGAELHASNPSVEDAERWATETADLIEAALGKGEVHLFAYASGVTLYSGGNKTRQQLWIEGRLHRLGQLIARVDSLELRPDFDPNEWTNR